MAGHSRRYTSSVRFATKSARSDGRSTATMMMKPSPKVILLLVGFFFSCTSAQAAPEILVTPGSTVTADQLEALLQTLTAHPDVHFVNVRELTYQMRPSSGRTTYLKAEALGIPRRVSSHLCHGELSLFYLSEEDGRWQESSQKEKFASYDARGLDPCGQAREWKSRFWIRGGVSMEELSGVLEVFSSAAPEGSALDAAAFSRARLLPDERVMLVTRTSPSAGESPIEIHTQRGESQGRVIEFDMRDGVWIARVKGGWIA